MTQQEFTTFLNQEVKRLFPERGFNSWVGAQVLIQGIITGYKLANPNLPEWFKEVEEDKGCNWGDKEPKQEEKWPGQLFGTLPDHLNT